MVLLPQLSLAQKPEVWSPTTNNALPLGNLQFTSTSLRISNGATYGLKKQRRMSFQPNYGDKATADVYEVTQEDSHGKTNFCGKDKIAFFLLWHPTAEVGEVNPRTLEAFRGPKLVRGSPDDCGRFAYNGPD